MVNSAEFAKRLQKILDYYGISATAFSEEIEVNRSTISHLLSGRNKPSLDFVMKVNDHYPEVELYWLLNGKGSFPPVSSEPKIEQSEIQNKTEARLPFIPSEENSEENPTLPIKDSEIDRIVIFYKDGRFKSYKN
jgi:transcriptional regulator with XRE-family HTH domain